MYLVLWTFMRCLLPQICLVLKIIATDWKLLRGGHSVCFATVLDAWNANRKCGILEESFGYIASGHHLWTWRFPKKFKSSRLHSFVTIQNKCTFWLNFWVFFSALELRLRTHFFVFWLNFRTRCFLYKIKFVSFLFQNAHHFVRKYCLVWVGKNRFDWGVSQRILGLHDQIEWVEIQKGLHFWLKF